MSLLLLPNLQFAAMSVQHFHMTSLVRMHLLLPLPSLQLSDDESDLEISSLEDLPQDLGQREKPKPLSRSKPLEKFGTSPWSPSRPKVPGW